MTNKTTTINVRIPEELKGRLETLSNYFKISSSQMIREMIEDYGLRLSAPKDHQDIIINLEFLELVIWLYQKKINPYTYRDEYSLYSQIIDQIQKSQIFSSMLKKEFQKVGDDINRVANLSFNEKNYFFFPLDSNPEKFDFNLLEEYLEKISSQSFYYL